MRFFSPAVVFVLLSSWTLTSCSVEARIRVLEGNQAEVSTRIAAQPAFLAYWKDLTDLDPTLPPTPLDEKTFRQTLDQQAAASPPRLTAPLVKRDAGAVVVSFGVPDINSLLGSKSLGKITSQNGKTDLLLTLDRKTLRTLFGLTTWGNSPALGSLVPAEKAKVTAKDYGRLLAYLLEPYDAASQALVDLSTVELRIELPSAPTLAEGVESVSGNTLVCRWPLTKVLSLETPITVHAVY